jgi:hypothetical protein
VKRPTFRATVLASTLLLASCASGADDTTGDALRGPDTQANATAAAPAPPPAVTPAAPESPAAYAPPADWIDRALASAEVARTAVVAVGWRPGPPAIVMRRLETGWLVAPDVVVTSHVVACEAQQGSDLRVRTIDGTLRRASVAEIIGGCEPWESGLGLLRLDRPVDAPTLTLRDGDALEVGEPLLAIGHSNTSAVIGGWLVLAGPMVESDAQWLWVDIGAPVNLGRIDEFFGGGFAGAPVVDIDGRIVSVLCCERDWGPQLDLRRSPVADPVLRSRLTVDAPYFVGGMSTSALRDALAPHIASR